MVSMDKILGNKKAYCVFTLPALIIYISLVVIPIFMTGYYSMLDWNGMGKATMAGFENFIGLFTNNSGFVTSVFNSFLLAVLSVAFQLPIALVLALILARGVKGEKFYRVAYFIPVVISSVVI
jgi:raffinose/stachyose/melibiose transport system permease protein